MKIIVFKISVFLLILAGLFYYVNSFFTNKKIYWHKSQEYKTSFSSTKNIDVAFFGSSHTLCSYDPRIIETELNRSAFNFGYANQRLATAIPLIKQVVKKFDLSMGVIDVFKASLEEPPYEEKVNAFQLKTFDYLPISFIKLKQMEEIYGLEDAFFKTPLLREHAVWPDKIFQDRFKLGLSQDYYNGFYTNTTFDNKSWKKITKKGEINNQPKIIDSLVVSDYEKMIVKELVVYFRNNQIPLLFVNAPMFKGSENNEFYTYNILLKQYLDSLGVTFINLNQHYDELGLTNEDFRDLSHLNSSGAIKATLFLTDFIKKDLPSLINSNINYSFNRYFHIENNFEEGLLYFQPQNLLKQKTNIESAGLYKINDQFLELIVEADKGSIHDVKVKISYKIGVSTDQYSIREQKLKLNKNNKYKNTVLLNESIYYKGQQYYIVRIPVPKGEIYDFTVFVNPLKKENIKIIKKDILRL